MRKVITTSLLTSTVVLGLLFSACNNSQNKSSDMEHHQQIHSAGVYACPMHPGETGKQGDKCSKCGMDLVAVADEHSTKTGVTLIAEPQSIEAGTPVQLAFAFKQNGSIVPLDISHEMKVHLIVVDESLSWFRHIHPEQQADGSYTIAETFPKGGKYFLFTDFKPKGQPPALDKKEIIVKGNAGNDNTDFSTQFVSVVDGYTVTLENGNDFKTNRAQSLEISVEKDGKKLAESDIEPYLAATAHIAMISKADKNFLHLHPLSDDHFPIYAETRIKKAGIYRIWVEFKTNGKVHTADLTVNVSEGEKSGSDKSHQDHQH